MTLPVSVVMLDVDGPRVNQARAFSGHMKRRENNLSVDTADRVWLDFSNLTTNNILERSVV